MLNDTISILGRTRRNTLSRRLAIGLLLAIVPSQLYSQSLAEAAKQQRDKLCKAGETKFCARPQQPKSEDKSWLGEALVHQEPTVTSSSESQPPQSAQEQVESLQRMVDNLADKSSRQLGDEFVRDVQFPGRDAWERSLDAAKNKFVAAGQVVINLLRSDKTASGALNNAETDMRLAQIRYSDVQAEGISKAADWQKKTGR